MLEEVFLYQARHYDHDVVLAQDLSVVKSLQNWVEDAEQHACTSRAKSIKSDESNKTRMKTVDYSDENKNYSDKNNNFLISDESVNSRYQTKR
jgi:hypothetical protein